MGAYGQAPRRQPSSHSSSTHRHKPNGSLAIESIPEIPGAEVQSSNGTRNPPTASSSSNRPTLHWPFRGHSLSQSTGQGSASHSANYSNNMHSARHSSKFSQSSFARRGSGWINLRPASSVLGSDIIPDYVVNFLRGETPETLAKKRERQEKEANAENAFRDRLTGFDFFSHSRNGSRGGDLENMAEMQPLSFGRKMMMGWRAGITLIILLSAIILLVAIVCVVLAASKSLLQPHHSAVLAMKCDVVGQIDQGVGALVNILSFFFIVSATYVSQVLLSPTREEVNTAHQEFHWLDIGIPSLKNLTKVSGLRAAVASIVVLFAVGSQLAYNSLLMTDYSTSKAASDTCSLYLNGPVLGAIALLNLLFIIVLATALAVTSNDQPLVTLGDAISSFLSDADPMTQGACLLSKSDVKSGLWAQREVKSKYWFNDTHWWMATPSRTRWLVWAVVWLLSAGLAAAALSVVLVDKSTGNAFIGLAQPIKLYDIGSGIPGSGLAVLLALPHLLLAIFYFTTNAMFSVYYLSHEFSQYAKESTPLRVSSQPFGMQRASLYITLPRPWSWALFFVFAAMGFMLVSALNMVSVDNKIYLGLNPLPLVVLLALVGVVGVVVLGLSARRTEIAPASDEEGRVGNALVLAGGSCSAVISARCQRSKHERAGMVAQALCWGVVQDETDPKVGHATLSSQAVSPMAVGKAYA